MKGNFLKKLGEETASLFHKVYKLSSRNIEKYKKIERILIKYCIEKLSFVKIKNIIMKDSYYKKLCKEKKYKVKFLKKGGWHFAHNDKESGFFV